MRRARSSQTLRKQAAAILEQNGVTEPPVPIDKVARSLGARVRYSPFEGELAGMLVRDGVRIIIGVNSLHHTNRQRFTVAHECGHLMLHKGEVHVDRTFRVNRRDEVSSRAENVEEIEANRFAAELLMPYPMIETELTEHEIDVEDEEELRRFAKRYQVSMQAMAHRITNLLDL